MFPILKYEFPKPSVNMGKPVSMQSEGANHGSSCVKATIPTAPATPNKQQQRFSQISTLRNSTPRTTQSERHSVAQASSPSSCSTRTDFSTPTLRERRGRRSVVDRAFTPLSVFTKSSLVPFTFDTDRAIQILRTDIPDRVDIAKEEVSPQDAWSSYKSMKPVRTTIAEQSPTRRPPKDLVTGMMRSGSPSDSVDTEIDLMTALNVTSPEQDGQSIITADFGTLTDLPAPDISEHPAYAADAFKSTSEAPLVITTSHAVEIRKYNPNCIRDEEKVKTLEKKRSFFGLDRLTPASIKTPSPASDADVQFRSVTGMQEVPIPPVHILKTRSNKAGAPLAKSPSTKVINSGQQTSAPVQSSSGVRKFSDLLRSKKSVPALRASRASSPEPVREKERGGLVSHFRRVIHRILTRG